MQSASDTSGLLNRTPHSGADVAFQLVAAAIS